MTTKQGNQIAANLAKDAKQNHFSSHRGVWDFEASDLLCYYNNHPYESMGDAPDRRLETECIRWWMAQEGIEEVGYSSWPTRGADKGYTTAILVRGTTQDAFIAMIEKVVSVIEWARDNWEK